jgi:hypothetical protein
MQTLLSLYAAYVISLTLACHNDVIAAACNLTTTVEVEA